MSMNGASTMTVMLITAAAVVLAVSIIVAATWGNGGHVQRPPHATSSARGAP